jgi:hypothetical protein
MPDQGASYALVSNGFEYSDVEHTDAAVLEKAYKCLRAYRRWPPQTPKISAATAARGVAEQPAQTVGWRW